MMFGAKFNKQGKKTLRGAVFMFYDPKWRDQKITYDRLFFEPEDIDGE